MGVEGGKAGCEAAPDRIPGRIFRRLAKLAFGAGQRGIILAGCCIGLNRNSCGCSAGGTPSRSHVVWGALYRYGSPTVPESLFGLAAREMEVIGYGIMAAGAQRLAAKDAPDCEYAAAQGAVARDRLASILRATGVEPAALAQQWADEALVKR